MQGGSGTRCCHCRTGPTVQPVPLALQRPHLELFALSASGSDTMQRAMEVQARAMQMLR